LEENLGCFRAEPAVRALLATTQKAREGLNLQEANQVVFVDDLWTPADIEQAYSRAYRSGQTRPVRVRHLRVKGTIDEWLVAKLTYKGDINREIIGLLEARLACSSP
jgi:SNF2 family DNA or RNA helicase